ncbi:MAG TPA: hypothetical protein VFL91_08525 [Thermomicrobiales bacterium]|nr:hypothetical protein [Thermomicrobiales bacterium]
MRAVRWLREVARASLRRWRGPGPDGHDRRVREIRELESRQRDVRARVRALAAEAAVTRREDRDA